MISTGMFLRRIGALVFASAIALSACQPSPATPQKPSGPADQPPAAQPAQKAGQPAPTASGPVTPKVNRLVFAVGPIGIESLDPTEVSPPETWQFRPMYENLLGVDPEGKEPVPELATSYSLEPDGKSYRFQLRKGVQFHHGLGEMTARDVRFAWERMVRPESKHGHTSYWRSIVEDVEIVSDHEVIFKLTAPDADFITSVSGAEAVLPIYSKTDFDSRDHFPLIGEQPIAGTGPYQLLERQQATFIRFQRVPYQHWRVTPDFPEFEYRLIRELSTRLAALKAKEIQIAGLPPEMVPQAEQEGFKTIKSRSSGLQSFVTFYGVYPNKYIRPGEKLNDDPNQVWVHPNNPLLDARVRQALSKAVNRDEFNKAFFRGIGEPIYLTMFREDRPGWNPEWKTRFNDLHGYDPAKARALLAEAGYGPSNPLKHNLILVTTAYFAAAQDMAEAISGYWRAIGVDVNLQITDGAQRQLLTRSLELNNHSEVVGTSVRQLRGISVYGARSSLSTQNGVGLPETDAIFEQKVRVAVDPQKADETWREFGDLAFERFMHVPLFWIPAEAVVDQNIVADYIFPGTITGLYTHVEYIKAAP